MAPYSLSSVTPLIPTLYKDPKGQDLLIPRVTSIDKFLTNPCFFITSRYCPKLVQMTPGRISVLFDKGQWELNEWSV